VLCAPAACKRSSILALTSGLSGWLLLMMASAAISERASPAKVLRTL
jgi:hypothetical protein